MQAETSTSTLVDSQTAGSVVDKAWRKRTSTSTARRSLRWVVVNVVMIFLTYIDLSYSIMGRLLDIHHPLFRIIEMTLCAVFVFNVLYDIVTYVKYIFSSQVEVTLEQKRLLGVKDQDAGFVLSPKKLHFSPASSPGLLPGLSPVSSGAYSPSSSPYSSFGHATPTNIGSFAGSLSGSYSFTSPLNSFMSMSPGHMSLDRLSGSYSFTSPSNSFMSMSPGHMYLDRSTSFNQSNLSGNLSGNMSFSPSMAYSPGQPMTSLDSSGIRSRLSTSFRSPSPSDKITDLHTLSMYIRDQEEKEYRASLCSPDMSYGNQSFWNYGRPAVDAFSHSLRKNQYQLASRSPQSHKSQSSDSDNIGGEVWRQFGITDDQLYIWIEKLRKWIGNTVMVNLSREIDKVNAGLRKIGCEDMEIGEVGVSQLKQLALTKGPYVPTLNVLVPYLDFSSNQEYLVKRLKELGSDGCISEFSWRSGGSGGVYGKAWGEHLPTDSGTVVHMFCCYLDSRLPPDIKYPDGKTFTSQHFIKTPDKPNLEKEDNLMIYQSAINPPHFQVVVKKTVYNLPSGRNNLFQAMLFFLYHIKTKERGMLGRVNLGMSGVNILSVLDD